MNTIMNMNMNIYKIITIVEYDHKHNWKIT